VVKVEGALVAPTLLSVPPPQAQTSINHPISLARVILFGL